MKHFKGNRLNQAPFHNTDIYRCNNMLNIFVFEITILFLTGNHRDSMLIVQEIAF